MHILRVAGSGVSRMNAHHVPGSQRTPVAGAPGEVCYLMMRAFRFARVPDRVELLEGSQTLERYENASRGLPLRKQRALRIRQAIAESESPIRSLGLLSGATG